jgi:hypothetical protein
VALEPFSLVHSVVHAVAAPVVHNAPRILIAAAVAPIKVAYYAPRRTKPHPPRAEQVYESDEESNARPIRVAYQVQGQRQTAAPQQDDFDYDQEQDQEQEQESAQIERRGDRPTESPMRLRARRRV